MNNHDDSNTGFLPPDDPNYREYQAASQFEPNPIAKQFAATLVGTCPRALRSDRSACADHIGGVVAAHGLGGLLEEGKRRGQDHLRTAEDAKDRMIEANDDLAAAIAVRRSLVDEVVTTPSRATRGDIRRQLSQNQRVAAQRELIGDMEHLSPGNPGWLGWMIAAVVAAIETVVTVRIFNVDLTDFSLADISWLALTTGLIFFNHNVSAFLGQKRRRARETQDAATRLNTTAMSRMHHDSTSTLAAGMQRPGQVAGLAPSAAEVRAARRGRLVASTIYGIPLVLLMIGMYVRLFASAGRLDLGLFGYVFPLIVVAVLAALLWALMVEPYSRGNSLGDHLREQQAVDAETVEQDLELLQRGREDVHEARRQFDIAKTALLSADEEVSDMAELGHRGLLIAHATLGVSTLSEVRRDNVNAHSYPQRDRIATAIEVALARTEQDAVGLEALRLPALEVLDSPHLVYLEPPSVEPDLEFVRPTSLASYPQSTLAAPVEEGVEPKRVGRGWKSVTAALAVIAAVAAGGIAYGEHTASNAATAPGGTSHAVVVTGSSTPTSATPKLKGPASI